MGYDFYRFSSGEFEDLVQALYQRLLGNSSLVFGLGPDGGRELSYEGPASYASPLETHDGLWIVQAKFRTRDVHDHDQYSWIKTQFQAEMRKFKSGDYPVPDQYIFVTNAVLTPGYRNGGRDKMQELIRHYQGLIPRIYVVAYDELNKLLANNADVRLAYTHLLSPGDQFAQIMELLNRQGIYRPFVMAGQEIRELPSQHDYNFNLPPAPILSIDFGTSYSLCGAISQRKEVKLVPTASGQRLLDSTISFFRNGAYSVGNPTLRHVRSSEIVQVSQIKRYLATGRRFDVFGTAYTAEQLTTFVIRSLKTSAEEYFGYTFDRAVVAKPGNYNLRQTKALREAVEQAGLTVVRILDEGTAPCYLFPQAMAHHRQRPETHFLVIDLGGGTFDLSLQEYSDEIYETLAVFGDNQLGGLDYDRAVLEVAAGKMKASYPSLRNLDFELYLGEAERVKKALSQADQATFLLADIDQGDGNLTDFSVSLSRDEFRRGTSALNAKIMRCINDVQRAASNDPAQTHRVDVVMLTGQGAKIFTVSELINDLFPGIPVINDFMENAVCLGNGYQAGVMHGIVRNQLLLSVHNTGLALLAREKGRRDPVSKNMQVRVSPIPQLNFTHVTLLEANATIPYAETFEFDLEIIDPRQQCISVPIFEVTEKGRHFEEILKLEIPVIAGLNLIRLKVDIDANHRMRLHLHNPANRFSEIFPIG